MSLDPDTEKEILVTPQPRRSPRIGWKERINKGKEEEEAKESSDKITEAYLSAAAEEEEHLETIEEHVAGLDQILEYPGVGEEIEIEEELAEEDSISSEESDSEFSCGETLSESSVGSDNNWSTYSYTSLYTDSDTDSYSELDSDSDSEESDGSSMKKSRRLYFGGEAGEFENFMLSWKTRGAKKGYSPYILDERYEDLPETGLMMDWTGVEKEVKRRQKKALKLHNYCIADLQEACEPRMISAWIEEYGNY